MFLFCRRIAYQEKTQSFGIVSVRTEVQDNNTNESRAVRNSASLTAHTIIKSAGTRGSSRSANPPQPDGITFGNDVECGSFLIVDQHTFEGKDFLNFY